jgi:hypothetical protein
VIFIDAILDTIFIKESIDSIQSMAITLEHSMLFAFFKFCSLFNAY